MQSNTNTACCEATWLRGFMECIIRWDHASGNNYLNSCHFCVCLIYNKKFDELKQWKFITGKTNRTYKEHNAREMYRMRDSQSSARFVVHQSFLLCCYGDFTKLALWNRQGGIRADVPEPHLGFHPFSSGCRVLRVSYSSEWADPWRSNVFISSGICSPLCWGGTSENPQTGLLHRGVGTDPLTHQYYDLILTAVLL